MSVARTSESFRFAAGCEERPCTVSIRRSGAGPSPHLWRLSNPISSSKRICSFSLAVRRTLHARGLEYLGVYVFSSGPSNTKERYNEPDGGRHLKFLLCQFTSPPCSFHTVGPPPLVFCCYPLVSSACALRDSAVDPRRSVVGCLRFYCVRSSAEHVAEGESQRRA